MMHPHSRNSSMEHSCHYITSAANSTTRTDSTGCIEHISDQTGNTAGILEYLPARCHRYRYQRRLSPDNKVRKMIPLARYLAPFTNSHFPFPRHQATLPLRASLKAGNPFLPIQYNSLQKPGLSFPVFNSSPPSISDSHTTSPNLGLKLGHYR